MDEIRTFICFELPAEVKSELKRVQDILRPQLGGVSWVKAEGIHLTLKFLGEVPSANLKAIAEAVQTTSAGFAAVILRLNGLGAFPSLQRPRVYWAGAAVQSGNLTGLQQSLEEALAKLGFPKEDRPFSPHLTLGRVKQFERRPSPAEVLGRVQLQPLEFTCGELVLMRSDLKPSGAEYTPLQKFPLR